MLKIVPKRHFWTTRFRRAAFEFLGSPFVWTIVLALGAAALLIGTERYRSTDFVERHGPNLVAEFVGILFTLVVVNWIVLRQRKRQVAPARDVGIGKLLFCLAGLTALLAEMLKAAASGPRDLPKGLKDLMDAWVHEVPRLNFLAAAPPRSPDGDDEINWGEHLAQEFRGLDGALSSVVYYSEFLGPSVLPNLEALRGTLVYIALREGVTKSEGRKPYPDREPLLALGSPESGLALREFSSRVTALVSDAEEIVSRDGFSLEIEPFIWRSNVTPFWGSARYSGPLEPRLVQRVILGAPRQPASRPESAIQTRYVPSPGPVRVKVDQRPLARRAAEWAIDAITGGKR